MLLPMRSNAQAETGTLYRSVFVVYNGSKLVGFLDAGAGFREQTDYPAAIARVLDGESATALGRFLASIAFVE